MSPQILNNEKYSYKCDIWSTGIVFYKMLFGTLPWKGVSYKDLYMKIKSEPLMFPKPISKETQDLIEKMLSFEEENRLSWVEVYNHIALNKDPWAALWSKYDLITY